MNKHLTTSCKPEKFHETNGNGQERREVIFHNRYIYPVSKDN